MKKEFAEFLADACGGELRDDYSGRGMYGRTCYGVVVDSPTDAMLMAMQELQSDPECYEDLEIPNGMAMDSMGYDTILY